MRSAAARRAGPGGGAARGGPHLGGCGSAARRRTRGRPRGRRRGPAASSHPPAPRGRGSGPTPAGSGSGSGHDRLPSRSPSQSAEAQARAPPPAASGSAGAGPGCGDEASADHQALPKEEDVSTRICRLPQQPRALSFPEHYWAWHLPGCSRQPPGVSYTPISQRRPLQFTPHRTSSPPVGCVWPLARLRASVSVISMPASSLQAPLTSPPCLSLGCVTLDAQPHPSELPGKHRSPSSRLPEPPAHPPPDAHRHQMKHLRADMKLFSSM
ncbi:laforin-like isoform X3 [Pongo pygmaeus]|uniref:laforin-like isoform X3 n=1 Tax=Pongo pygmaeus TaxID=9600 RepID=UPI00300DA412